MPDTSRPFTGVGTQRLQEVAPGEFAEEVYVRDAWSSAISLGRSYLVGTGAVSLSVAGNMRVVITNPAAASAEGAVVVTLLGIGGLATNTGWATLYRNPTTGVPTVAARPHLRMNPLAGSAATTEVRVDTSGATALAGGADTGVVLGFPANVRTQITGLGLVVPPGESIGINIPFAGSAMVAASLYIVEEKVA